MRILLLFTLLMPSVGLSMIGLFGSNNEDILNQLCCDLSCSKEEILNQIYRLRCSQGLLESDRENLRQEREIFKAHCEEYEGTLIAACSEKSASLLAESEVKCAELEEESRSRCTELEKKAKELETRIFHLNNMTSDLNDLCKISEGKDYVCACTPDDTKAIFRRSDFERDARFLSCGLYPFLFSENFKGIERANGFRELRDLDGDDLLLLAQGIKHPDYKVSGFQLLDKKMKEVFNTRLDFYCLSCKNGVLGVLGMEPERSFGWCDVKEETVGGKTFTYHVLNLNDVDFEFVAVPFGEDGEVEFMMSHWITQGQWSAVMRENPAYFAGRGLDLPMESVSYSDIVNNFLPRLNNLLQDAGFEGEFKLPNDAQWQRMADKNVAADFASNKSKYSDFGKDCCRDQPLSAKSKARGNLGARMFGSVWEFVDVATASGDLAIRGGSWYNGFINVGPSAHYSLRSDDGYRGFGFRLLRAYSE